MAWEYLDIARVYPRGTRLGVYADLFVLWDVNDSGRAVGSKSRYGLAGSSAIMTDPAFESVEYLPTPYGGRAFAINERDQIVGVTGESRNTGTFAHAFLYEAGTVTDLGTLGGLRSSASDINESSQVVGSSLVTDPTSLQLPDPYHAFVWDGAGGMVDLNDLVDASSWVLTAASAINDAGDIVGTGLKDGQRHGFLLLGDGSVVPPPPANDPPLAVASSDVSRGRAPLTVHFDASDSTDPDGSALSYHWDFGDGTTSSESSPTHTYETEGSYLVVLTVADEGGLSDSAQLEITVRRARGRKK
jgi:probable HAF family extracellular repeat protein